MQPKQVILKKIGDKYVSAANSLVVEMAESAESFRSAGFEPLALREMTKMDERFIVENHPELQAELRSGALRIEPIEMQGWRNRNGYFHEIDYKIVRAPKTTREQYVVQEEDSLLQLLQDRSSAPDFSRVNARTLGSVTTQRQRGQTWQDPLMLSLWPVLREFHDPIYIFYENEPGKLRGVVLEILMNLIEVTTLAAAVVRGKDSRRFKQSIKELARLQGIPESTLMQRIDARVQRLAQTSRIETPRA